MVTSWLVALYGTKLHTGLVAGRLGHVLHRRVTTGEVMSISTSDANTFGATLEATGRALGALLTFGGVVVLMYTSTPELATLVLVVSPLMLAASTPALLPLNAAQLAERTQNSRLTSLATDIVAGLRILRGISNEQTFETNYARHIEDRKSVV